MTARFKLIGAMLVGAVLGILLLSFTYSWISWLRILSRYGSHGSVFSSYWLWSLWLSRVTLPTCLSGGLLGGMTAYAWLSQQHGRRVWERVIFSVAVPVSLYSLIQHLDRIAYWLIRRPPWNVTTGSILPFLIVTTVCDPVVWWSLLLMRWGYVLNKRSQA